MTDNGQTNDGAKGIVITSTTFLHLPVELDVNGPEMFTLVAMTREYTENGVARKQNELRMRCNDCDWGYNSFSFVCLSDVLNVGRDARYHVEHCPKTGRTLDLESPKIGH